MAQVEIIMYGTTWCPDCTRAKRFLEARKVPYQWINIDNDSEGADLVVQLNKGRRIVPTIIFPDGSILAEPTNAQLASKLGV